MSEVAFIGDIHGSSVQLEKILPAVLRRTSRLVFLGDYLNRGPDSSRVLDVLIQLRDSPELSTVFLEGNHERVFMNSIRTQEITELLQVGGAPTIASYLSGPPRADVASQLIQCVPDAHIGFLEALQHDVLIDDVYATHSLAARGKQATQARFCVYGHSPQAGLEPRITSSQALIDTGCGTLPNGRLTALFWPSLSWIQAD